MQKIKQTFKKIKSLTKTSPPLPRHEHFRIGVRPGRPPNSRTKLPSASVHLHRLGMGVEVEACRRCQASEGKRVDFDVGRQHACRDHVTNLRLEIFFDLVREGPNLGQ